MKRLLLASTAFILLIGCQGQASTATLDLTFKTDDEIQRSLLLTASERVIERMAFGLEESVPDINVEHNGDTERITVIMSQEESAAILQENLARPIGFQVMIEAEEDETPDISNEQYGSFMYTDITEEHIDWVQADTVEGGQGILNITFDESGQEMLTQLFADNIGKRIGLFVRGGLVSTYIIEGSDDDRKNIIITGIPSPELANIFADDVNVGTYVTFTPIP